MAVEYFRHAVGGEALEISLLSPDQEIVINMILIIRAELIEAVDNKMGRINGMHWILDKAVEFEAQLEESLSPDRCAAWYCLIHGESPDDFECLDFPDPHSVEAFIRRLIKEVGVMPVVDE